MRLHPLISARTETFAAVYASQPGYAITQPGFLPQAEAGCIASCVNTTSANACSAKCRVDDVACWDQCAGEGKGRCIAMRCNN